MDMSCSPGQVEHQLSSDRQVPALVSPVAMLPSVSGSKLPNQPLPERAVDDAHNTPPGAHLARGYLERQLAVAWQLTAYHLEGLTTDECLWRPAPQGLHVHREDQGRWVADWPTTEAYSLGPSSIGWLTWHLGFWWSMALEHNFGEGKLTREDVGWPGEADLVRAWIAGLQQRWSVILAGLTDADLASSARVRWPFQDRPLGDLFAWANTELAKNGAEIGYARFLHAVSARGGT
jgi:hypothetical protein